MACDNCTCQGKSGGCTSIVATGPSVSLRKKRSGNNEQRGKLWTATSPSSNQYGTMSSTTSTAVNINGEDLNDGEQHSLLESSPVKKCEKHNGVRGVCCRDLKQDQRHLIDPDIVRDVIIGLSDGLTVPFALTAGLSGVGSSRIVVIAGLAELVSQGGDAKDLTLVIYGCLLPPPLSFPPYFSFNRLVELSLWV